MLLHRYQCVFTGSEEHQANGLSFQIQCNGDIDLYFLWNCETGDSYLLFFGKTINYQGSFIFVSVKYCKACPGYAPGTCMNFINNCVVPAMTNCCLYEAPMKEYLILYVLGC